MVTPHCGKKSKTEIIHPVGHAHSCRTDAFEGLELACATASTPTMATLLRTLALTRTGRPFSSALVSGRRYFRALPDDDHAGELTGKLADAAELARRQKSATADYG
ncbi:hypothetical protein KCP78_24860 [Salmonella enterica subsp. enterica]|nr:hypothetical protein KCP78_24860 [Salmonella enterica subsp. enterica]